ncbi:MAG: pyridoxamine 5'-phosphate oxidase, partial [Proteobacteria bacterium]|nr:pyridoxamine 5'-phosphate oxidase [Pseudomonadota bacterium]
MDKKNPIEHFHEWFEDAKKSEPSLPEAMSVATVSKSGQPSSRMVLLKSADAKGFVFYTNTESRKGLEIKGNPRASLLFHWKSLQRQVRIAGAISEVAPEEADAYFSSRPRGAQIGAWASQQSRPMAGSLDLEKAVARFTAKFGVKTIERPPFWTGYRVFPEEMEFWSERRFRLHLREFYSRDGECWRS